MRMMLAMGLVLTLTACGIAPKKETPAQTAAATRVYPNKTAAEVVGASREVLELLDPGRMNIEVEGNTIRARRHFSYQSKRIGYRGNTTTFYNVPMTLVAWYSVSVSEDPAGARATFAFQDREDMTNGYGLVPVLQAIHYSYPERITLNGRRDVRNLTLFHDRVEQRLGLREAWTTCGMVREEGEHLHLCDEPGLKDAAPEVGQ